jgi:hypothetical protein
MSTVPKSLPDYNVGLSSRHSYTLLKKKGLVELFGKTNGLRVILAKLSKTTKEGIGLATIPVDDLINPTNETRQYFLYPLKKEMVG